jgi:hypothetical protein
MRSLRKKKEFKSLPFHLDFLASMHNLQATLKLCEAAEEEKFKSKKEECQKGEEHKGFLL